MRQSCVRALPILLLGMSAAAASERVDLAGIDRSIAKEPAYRTASQEYCLLVFGEKADTRVWLVRDGATLYVDRNGNGDLTEPGEAFTTTYQHNPWWNNFGDIRAQDGKKTYRELEVQRVSQGYRVTVNIGVGRYQSAGAMQADKPKFAAKAKDAPMIHFDGPLALAQYSTTRVIPRNNTGGTRVRSLRLMVGTPGLGAGTFAAHDCCLCDNLGPLVATFVFPSSGGWFTQPAPPIVSTESFTYED
jgi:hypothetical protein